MLKLIQNMKSNTDSWPEIHKRICALPESGSFYVRYTMGELVQAAKFQSDFFMQFTPAQINKFNSRFNQLELELVKQISNAAGRSDKLQGIERRVKSMTQRTVRTIESVAMDLEYEAEINELKDKQAKSKRLNPVETTMADQWSKLQSIF
ncbi:MAG: hypothetical protein ABW116_01595 [Candidatus Sedimenticola sp. 20ELBAFRAG]